MNLKQAKELVRSRLSDKRYEHTINVKKMAVKLAKHYGADEEQAALAALLPDAKPVMESMPGWKCDISGCRRWEDLPQAARNYVEYVERQIGCHITYVSVGPERDSIIIR